MIRQSNPESGENGFTLLEILVGLAISSLIMLGLSQAVQSINAGYESTTAAIERQSRIATGLHVAAQDISRIERAVDNAAQPTRFLFSGQPQSLTYVLAERPGNNQDGLYWVRMFVRSTAAGEELVRQRAPFRQANTDLALIAWEDEVPLLGGNVRIGFAYRAPRAGLRSWADTWQAGNMLPGQIKIEVIDVATGRLRVPAFVGTLKIGAEADCGSAQAVGCTMDSEGALLSTAARQ